MKFTVFELIPGKFVWYVHTDDDQLVDSWSKTTYVEDDTLKGEVSFKSEADARKHVVVHYPDARDVHTLK